jgi:hypothetical protein
MIKKRRMHAGFLLGKLERLRPLGMKAWKDAKMILKVILDRIDG